MTTVQIKQDMIQPIVIYGWQELKKDDFVSQEDCIKEILEK
jgi:hypothetical protein